RASTGQLGPRDERAAAGRAPRARVPDVVAAGVAHGQHQSAGGGGRPEGFGLGAVGRGRGGPLAHRLHAPITRVALPWRVERAPPVPWARASSQPGTCTAGCASPRSWRTASIAFVMPPRFPGWLLQSPPPSVLKGRRPPGLRRPPSATN